MAAEEEALYSIEAELANAEMAAAQGRHVEAERYYRRLVAHANVIDYEYEEWARRLAEIYVAMGRLREAGFVYLYLHQLERARDVFRKAGASAERALGFALEKRWSEAAAGYLAAGRIVGAAVAYEEAKDRARARDLWAQLVRDPRLETRPYERALVHMNLGLAGGDAADAHGHLALAQRLLEKVADDFETAGERERAFDCYLILLKLGRDSGAFENVAEGYVNCIRVLKEDGLKFYALQYYEDFIALALEKRELVAAALLCREAAEYALRSGLPYHRHYLRRAAETWWQAADAGERGGASPELTENALLSSIDCFAAVGDFGKVRDSYRRLAALDLTDRRRQRYAALAERFRDAPTTVADAPAFPEYLRQGHAYAEIWFADLVEWELDGDPEQVAATIVGDLRYPDAFRRRALNLILLCADARVRRALDAPETLTRVAEGLGELQSYPALRPLERLYEHPDARVRRAAVGALRRMHFKRSFKGVARGLADADSGVREAAIEALRALHFPHAFHPLARIYREHPDERVRAVALESIGRIGSIEAGELLASVLRHETGTLREVARRALSSFENPDVAPLLRAHADLEPRAEVRSALLEVLGRLRVGTR